MHRCFDDTGGPPAAISYGGTKITQKLMRFEVFDRENYAAAMTAVTADLLASLGSRLP